MTAIRPGSGWLIWCRKNPNYSEKTLGVLFANGITFLQESQRYNQINLHTMNPKTLKNLGLHEQDISPCAYLARLMHTDYAFEVEHFTADQHDELIARIEQLTHVSADDLLGRLAAYGVIVPPAGW